MKTGGLNLIVLAGFSSQECREVERRKEKAGLEKVTLASVPFGIGQKSYTPAYISTTLKKCKEMVAARQARSSKEPYAPVNIALIYKPMHRCRALLDACFSFCRCLECITGPDLDIPLEIIKIIKDKRLQRQFFFAPNEPQLLPLRNYYHAHDASLYDTITDGCLKGPEPCFARIRFQTKSEKRAKGRRVKKGFVDDRELVFVSTKARHGRVRPPESVKDYAVITYLSGLYRFGRPVPPGMHYDVQKIPNQSLARNEFYCAADRSFKAQPSQYVNIYPNDVVRFPKG